MENMQDFELIECVFLNLYVSMLTTNHISVHFNTFGLDDALFLIQSALCAILNSLDIKHTFIDFCGQTVANNEVLKLSVLDLCICRWIRSPILEAEFFFLGVLKPFFLF